MAIGILSALIASTPAFALSAACATLNANSGSTYYSQNFPASQFEAGESVTVSFTDNGGDPKTVPHINSAQIRLNNYASSNVFYQYSSYTGTTGQHSGSHTALSTSGLTIVIDAKTFLSPVSIVCASATTSPSLASASPNSGPIAGSTNVTLSGTNLGGATSVTFGGTPGTITNATATSLSVTTPAHTAGTVDVVIATPDGNASLANGFTYLAPLPVISSASPNIVTTAGNTTVTLNGTGLSGASSVSFGGTPGIVSSSSATTATVTAPAHAAGTVDITLTTPDGPATLTGAFTYVAPTPALSGASPNGGSTGGGTTVTLWGTNLSGATHVSFGGTPGTVSSSTATSATVISPPHAAGSVDVVISTPDGDATLSHGFTYATPASFAFTPAGGALPEAMAGEDYSQSISATGGSGPLTYGIVSGALPDGMVLNLTTGELTGPLASDAEAKSYAFTVQVRDGNGATGTADYTMAVIDRKVTVTNKQVQVPSGATPVNIDLTAGATGGPFASADVVEVHPTTAGKATIVNGEFAQLGGGTPGWYLKFIPNPSYSGQAVVQFRLTSAIGTSNTGSVTYALSFDAATVATETDTLVHGFTQTRQSLIASTLAVPGLAERRQMQAAFDPLTARLSPSIDGLHAYFSTSLVQMNAASAAAEGVGTAEILPFNVWAEGTVMVHNRRDNGNRWGSFGMLSAGADYLISEKVLLGLSLHYDRMSDPTNSDAVLTGNGWLAGPYASVELGTGVFWNTGIRYGGSANAIDTALWGGSFNTTRWLLDTAVTGQWTLNDTLAIAPRLRAVYLSETIGDYAVANGNGDIIELKGFATEQLRVSVGADLTNRIALENGAILTPRVGLTGGFAGLNGAGAFGQASTGLSLDMPASLSLDLGLLLGIEGQGQVSSGIKVGARGQF